MKKYLNVKVIIVLTICFVAAFSQKPNIVFIITDDQDSEMDSVSAMPKLQALIKDKGTSFFNSYVVTPLCCPSRSSILTGQYVHNHGAINNSFSGGCSSTEWQNGPETRTFATYLHDNGYKTFFAGKYLNQYGYSDAGGLSHIPPGWDTWIGLQGNSVYYNYSLSVNGIGVFHGDNPDQDYLTNVINHVGVEFINNLETDSPFFMMLSTPACHAPFTPEPKYENNLNSSEIPITPNFNIASTNKNWFVRLGEQPLRDEIIDQIEDIYRDRLRTLLSVDDLVEDIINALGTKNLLENTYIIYTSDHGYHLGQFSLAKDKREPYEFDIKVPFMIRGPGITEALQVEDVITNIDIAPTFLQFAGIAIPSHMDGKPIPTTVQSADIPEERSILIEHSGEGDDFPPVDCEYLGEGLAYCSPELDCKCQDAWNNTYNCIRTIGNLKNEIYCKWDDDEQFEEYYNITTDPYELDNQIDSLSIDYYNNLMDSFIYLLNCSGSNCSAPLKKK